MFAHIQKLTKYFSRKPALTVCSFIMIGLLVAAGIVYYLSRDTTVSNAFTPSRSPSVQQKNEPTNNQNNDLKLTYCSRLANVLRCQDGVDGKPYRLALPTAAARAETFVQSPERERFLAVGPANPFKAGKAKRVTVFDGALREIREVPKAIAEKASAITWAANDNYLLYSVAQDTRQTLFVYDIARDISRHVSEQGYEADNPSVSSDGKTVVLSRIANDGKASFIAVNYADGKAAQLNTSAVDAAVSRYIAARYDSAEDVWYITGSKDDKPVLIIARNDNGALQVAHTVRDGAYTLVQSGVGGMLASNTGSGIQYGSLNAAGTFTVLTSIPPLDNAIIVIARPFKAAKMVDVAKADDYYHDYTQASKAMTAYARTLLMQGCQNGSYNQVDVVARSTDNQFVADVTSCRDATTHRAYYGRQGNTYIPLVQPGGLTDCESLAGKGIVAELRGDCAPDDHGSEPPAAASSNDSQIPASNNQNPSYDTITIPQP